MTAIASLTCADKHLQVDWADGVSTNFPWVWLREHAHDDETLHPITQQRQIFTAQIPRDLIANHVRVVDQSLEIRWGMPDGSISQIPLAFLHRFRIPQPACAELGTQRTLWDTLTNTNTPTLPYDFVMGDDDGVLAWLNKVAEFGFCLVVNTPVSMEASEALLRRIAYVRKTIFAGFFDFAPDLTKADTAYTNLELRPHTDGTYSNDAPGAQMLHCLYFDGTGGESTIVDAFALAARLRNEHPTHYETLSRVIVPGQYIGDGSHLVAARPVLRHDHLGNLAQVSFNNYDRAPFLLESSEMIAFYDALRTFDLLANDHSRQWRHVLAPGEALLFDNWRVLHGREAFTGMRRLCGGYVNREDMLSRVRLLSNSD
jgi:trimethyllysine dioxygenase